MSEPFEVARDVDQLSQIPFVKLPAQPSMGQLIRVMVVELNEEKEYAKCQTVDFGDPPTDIYVKKGQLVKRNQNWHTIAQPGKMLFVEITHIPVIELEQEIYYASFSRVDMRHALSFRNMIQCLFMSYKLAQTYHLDLDHIPKITEEHMETWISQLVNHYQQHGTDRMNYDQIQLLPAAPFMLKIYLNLNQLFEWLESDPEAALKESVLASYPFDRIGIDVVVEKIGMICLHPNGSQLIKQLVSQTFEFEFSSELKAKIPQEQQKYIPDITIQLKPGSISKPIYYFEIRAACYSEARRAWKLVCEEHFSKICGKLPLGAMMFCDEI